MGYGEEDRKRVADLFHVDHQRHTEMVCHSFRSLFIEPTTTPV
jgi:hypothetical protein